MNGARCTWLRVETCIEPRCKEAGECIHNKMLDDIAKATRSVGDLRRVSVTTESLSSGKPIPREPIAAEAKASVQPKTKSGLD